MKRCAFSTLAALFLSCPVLFGQEIASRPFAIEVTGTVGPMFTVMRSAHPHEDTEYDAGVGSFLRAVWHPDHLLAVGLQSGYSVLTRQRLTSSDSVSLAAGPTDATLSAIPLQAIISMQKHGFELALGVGPYIVQSTLSGGQSAVGTRWELGMTFIGSYAASLGTAWRIGPEVRVLLFSNRNLVSVMPALTVQFTPWSYEVTP